MSDERFRRLLESPLDEPREPMNGRFRVLGAVVAGAILGGLAAFVVTSGGDDAAVTNTTAPPAAAPITTAASGPGMPDGFIAVSEEIGVRPEWMTVTADRLLVAVSTVVGDGIDRTTVDRFRGGLWTARVGADEVAFVQEHRDPLALGVVTVEFPATEVDPEDITALEVIPATSQRSEVIATTETVDGLPWTAIDDRFSFSVEDGVDLVVDAMALRLEGGQITWHVESDDVVRATVVPRIALIAGGVDTGAVLAPEHLQDMKPVRRNPAPSSFAVQRTEQISRGDRPAIRDRPLDPAAISELRIEWTITWQRYDADSIPIPMDGVTIRQ